MPELPEVERAAALIRSVGAGKRIINVETMEDPIVYAGTTHEEFANEIKDRTLEDAQRYGKMFYLKLSGSGKMPVLHFGMTGMIQIRGQLPTYYKRTPKSINAQQWPPRFVKFILHLSDPKDASGTITELAFLDARRLGRIRLCASPMKEPPISALGFDPILSMPSLEDFTPLVLKRACPIKALLLDQSFSAGVGNWVADEVLYNARVHPEQRCNTLSEDQIRALHHQIAEVCRIAVSVNADHKRFPEHWLFSHRWGKGKRAKKNSLTLSSGEPATIKWLTVGGRTSAYVDELQILPPGHQKVIRKRGKQQNPEDEETDGGEVSEESKLTALSESDAEDVPPTPKRKAPRTPASARPARRRKVSQENGSQGEGSTEVINSSTARRSPRKKANR